MNFSDIDFSLVPNSKMEDIIDDRSSDRSDRDRDDRDDRDDRYDDKDRHQSAMISILAYCAMTEEEGEREIKLNI